MFLIYPTATDIATFSGMGHAFGYARVSTGDQDARLQHDALEAAGCYKVFTDTAPGHWPRAQSWESSSINFARATRSWSGDWIGWADRFGI